MRPTRRRLVAPALAAAMSLAGVLPAAAAGPTNPPSGGCSAGSAQLVGQYSSPQPIVSGTGTLVCPKPGTTDPGGFGPPHYTTPQPPTPGTVCDVTYNTPVLARINGSTPELRFMYPASAAGTAVGAHISIDPNAPAMVTGGWNPLGAGTKDQQIFDQASTLDEYEQYEFKGTWNAQGLCDAIFNPPTSGWTTPCPQGSFLCGIITAPPPGPVQPGPFPGPLPINLGAFVTGQLNGGALTSLPAQPQNPALVGLATCFYVSGMALTGGGNPLLDHYWEQIVQGPLIPNTNGRHVFYVFVIHVYLQQTIFDWGDGTSDQVGVGGSPEPIPLACQNIANQQFLVAHTYRSYSTGNGFQVKVIHQYAADATERWIDGAGSNGPIPAGAVTVPVPTLPNPFLVQVIQEEGVPVANP